MKRQRRDSSPVLHSRAQNSRGWGGRTPSYHLERNFSRSPTPHRAVVSRQRSASSVSGSSSDRSVSRSPVGRRPVHRLPATNTAVGTSPNILIGKHGNRNPQQKSQRKAKHSQASFFFQSQCRFNSLLSSRRTIIIGRPCQILLGLSRIRIATRCHLRPASHLPITLIYPSCLKNQLLLWCPSRNPELILVSPRTLALNPSGNQALHLNAFSLLTTMTWTASVHSRRPQKRLTDFSNSPLVPPSQSGKNSTISRKNNGRLQSRS